MNRQFDLETDILAVLRNRNSDMTYVIANRLRMDHKKYSGTLTTAQVLRRLKSLERRNCVKRVPSSYAVQLRWAAV